MRLDGLIFDMGDILFDASLWRRWLTDRLNERGVSITYDQLVERWEALLVDVYCGQADYWQRFAQLLANEGLGADAAAALTEEARQKGKELVSDRELFEGVSETLTRLHVAGVKLAVLSDNESGEAGLRGMLADLGIEDCFDAVISSRDIGFAKPSAEAFSAAADALGLASDRCGFVGHDVDELAGAKAGGLYAIAFNYHPDAPADAYLERFSELEAVVKDSHERN